MANKNIKNIGVKFGSGQDPTKGGRKKKIYTVLKEQGYSKDDVTTAFQEIAFYTVADLQKVAKDPKTPSIVIVIAMAFKNAIKTGDYKQIQAIMEHVVGKPMQRVETKVDVTTPQFEGFGFLPEFDKEK